MEIKIRPKAWGLVRSRREEDGTPSGDRFLMFPEHGTTNVVLIGPLPDDVWEQFQIFVADPVAAAEAARARAQILIPDGAKPA